MTTEELEAKFEALDVHVEKVVKASNGGYLRRLESAVQDLAYELGFDLVKRQTPQEAHEAQLARRLAEQADETVGFR